MQFSKINNNWQQLTQSKNNWQQPTTIDNNWQKATKSDKNWQRLTRIDNNWQRVMGMGPIPQSLAKCGCRDMSRQELWLCHSVTAKGWRVPMHWHSENSCQTPFLIVTIAVALCVWQQLMTSDKIKDSQWQVTKLTTVHCQLTNQQWQLTTIGNN